MKEYRQITLPNSQLRHHFSCWPRLRWQQGFKDSALKDNALIQLFENLAGNMSDCFKRWRDINSIEKLREKRNSQQKENVIRPWMACWPLERKINSERPSTSSDRSEEPTKSKEPSCRDSSWARLVWLWLLTERFKLFQRERTEAPSWKPQDSKSDWSLLLIEHSRDLWAPSVMNEKKDKL